MRQKVNQYISNELQFSFICLVSFSKCYIHTKEMRSKMKKKMHIVSSTDDNYAQHLGMTLSSLLENTSSPEDIVISIIDGGISREKKQLLKETAAIHGAPLDFLTVNVEIYKGAIASRHISKAAYYRISIPEMMDPAIERTLYVDCDMLILDDVKKLFDIEMEGNIIAAVGDYGEHHRLEKWASPRKIVISTLVCC